MDPRVLLDRLYYGDEGVKEVLIDGSSNVVKVKITRLTLLEEGRRPWECSLSVENPWLVFEDATSIQFEPAGLIPSDFVEEISIIGQDEESSRLKFAIRTGHGSGPLTVLISAKSIRVDHPLWTA